MLGNRSETMSFIQHVPNKGNRNETMSFIQHVSNKGNRSETIVLFNMFQITCDDRLQSKVTEVN